MGFESQRAVAERAIALYEENGAEEPAFPSAAQRIRQAREAAGLTQDEVAGRWREQPSMYWDLELYDEEVFTVISVREVQRLAPALQTSVNQLLFGEEPPSPLPSIRYRDVIARLQERLRDERVTVEQLGDEIGWDLEPLLSDPSNLGDLPIVGLWSVCRAAHVDWVAVVNTPEVT